MEWPPFPKSPRRLVVQEEVKSISTQTGGTQRTGLLSRKCLQSRILETLAMIRASLSGIPFLA